MLLFLSGSRQVLRDVIESHVESELEGTRPSCRLGKQEAALQSANDSGSQIIRIGISMKFASIPHRCEAESKMGLPCRETSNQESPRILRAISQLTGKGSDRAASNATILAIYLENLVSPFSQIRQRFDLQQASFLEVENMSGLCLHDRAHQRISVGEIVIKLRFAGPAGLHDVVQARACRSLDQHQPGGGLDDARPCRGTSRRDGLRPCRSSVRAHPGILTTIGLDSPL